MSSMQFSLLKNKLLNFNGEKESKQCDYIEFPNHRQLSRRNKCGAILMKNIHTGNKITKFVPRKTYNYHSIISSLSNLIQCKHFLRKCEAWRQNTTLDDVMTDLYDGKVWKEFSHLDGQP